MIIDNKKPAFEDLPDSLNGQVLLERGKNGFLTATIEAVNAMKGKTDAELSAAGWLKYKDIIANIRLM